MENEFKLVEDINPSKNTFNVREISEFSKLTLSSRKKNIVPPSRDDKTDESDNENEKETQVKHIFTKKKVSRSLLKELLTDDESENEAEELNRLFLSRTSQQKQQKEGTVTVLTDNACTAQQILITKRNDATATTIEESNITTITTSRYSMEFSKKLELSDSDITSCSSDYKSTNSSMNKSENHVVCGQTETEMGHLYVSDDDENDKEIKQEILSTESLFSTENDDQQKFKNDNSIDDLKILSAQVQQLGIKSPPIVNNPITKNKFMNDEMKEIAEADTLSVTTSYILSTENEQKKSILCPLTPPVRRSKEVNKLSSLTTEDNDDDDIEYESNSIYTVGDSSKSVIISETDDETKIDENTSSINDNVIVISSDTESERSYNVQISDIKPSTGRESCLSLPNTEENIRIKRLKEYLDNIPLVKPGIEKISTQKSYPSVSKRFNYDLKKEPNEHFVEDSIEIAETSTENEHDLDDTKNQKKITNQKTPSKKTHQSSEKIEKNNDNADIPQQPNTPSSLQDSETCIEKINISATIKIKFKLKDPVITYTSSSTNISRDEQNINNEMCHESDDEENNSKSKNETKIRTTNDNQHDNENDNNFNNVRLSDAESQHTVECKKSAKNTPVDNTNNDPSNSQKINEPNDNLIDEKEQTKLEIDDLAKTLLTKLYGNKWQTPEVIKKLDKNLSNSKYEDESTLGNFTNFHHNILPDLHSTKLRQETFTKDILDDSKNFKKPIAQVKPIRGSEKKLENPKDNIEIKISKKGRKIKPRKYRISSSSSSENQSDFDADTEDSLSLQSISESESSDDDRSKKYTKTRKKNKSKKIVYLDLSDDCVKVKNNCDTSEVDNDATFKDRLDKLLQTCKYEGKSQIPATPQTTQKTKRKLFTPRYDEEDFIDDSNLEKNIKKLENSPTYKNAVAVDNEDDSIKLKYPLPPLFSLVNKQLESVKTGTPIFKIRTPQKESSNKKQITSDESPSNEKKKNDKMSTPKTPFQKIPVPDKTTMTPLDKYGFLRSFDVTISKIHCHPDALYYRENFKTKKDELAQKLYALYNEKVFDNKLNVPIKWNKKLLTTAGRCCNKKNSEGRQSYIELSEKVITSADRLRCTLIHELCHAATWVLCGEESGHNAIWKKWASRANQIFPELPKIKVCHQYDIEYKYTYKCTLCEAKSYAHSKSKKIENIRCAYCHGAIGVYLNRKDKEGNIMHTPIREPTGFAKFVKENYKRYKTPDRKHADVMKILSNEFASIDVKEKKIKTTKK